MKRNTQLFFTSFIITLTVACAIYFIYTADVSTKSVAGFMDAQTAFNVSVDDKDDMTVTLFNRSANIPVGWVKYAEDYMNISLKTNEFLLRFLETPDEINIIKPTIVIFKNYDVIHTEYERNMNALVTAFKKIQG